MTPSTISTVGLTVRPGLDSLCDDVVCGAVYFALDPNSPAAPPLPPAQPTQPAAASPPRPGAPNHPALPPEPPLKPLPPAPATSPARPPSQAADPVQLSASKLYPLPINNPASGRSAVPSEMKIEISCPGRQPGEPTAAPDTAPEGTTAAPNRAFGVGTAAATPAADAAGGTLTVAGPPATDSPPTPAARDSATDFVSSTPAASPAPRLPPWGAVSRRC